MALLKTAYCRGYLLRVRFGNIYFFIELFLFYDLDVNYFAIVAAIIT